MNSFDPHRLDDACRASRMMFYLRCAETARYASRWDEVDRWRATAKRLSFTPALDPDEPTMVGEKFKTY